MLKMMSKKIFTLFTQKIFVYLNLCPCLSYFPINYILNRSSVVECLPLDQRHWVVSLSKKINPSLVLVQPRKTRPFITERLLMGRKESNQTNNQTS